MSSKIEIEKVCEYCNSTFIAKTIKTRYCSHNCNQRHYKQLVRDNKLKKAVKETELKGKLKITIDFPELAKKELLTIIETCALLNITHVTLRRWIKEGRIITARIGKKHLIQRKHLDHLIEQ